VVTQAEVDSKRVTTHAVVPVKAQHLRLCPLTWQGHISMRWDLVFWQ
jgi:hypothetical protein